jgi:hypothetical protein
MNKQAIFDKVALHLLTQGERAFSQKEDQCKYFDEETGKTCAVGCLISKKNYDPVIEGTAVGHFLDGQANYISWAEQYLKFKNILHKEGIRNKQFSLLADLQTIHDRTDPEDWPVALIDFAKENKLHHGVVDNFVKKHK